MIFESGDFLSDPWASVPIARTRAIGEEIIFTAGYFDLPLEFLPAALTTHRRGH